MIPMADLMERARAARDPNLICARVPYAHFLGMTAALQQDRDGETVRVTMPFIERIGGNLAVPAIHGGALSSLMETAALLTASWRAGVPASTITLTVDYLRPAFLEDTVATCAVLRHGRRVMTVQVYADQGERRVSAARVHMMLRSPQG